MSWLFEQSLWAYGILAAAMLALGALWLERRTRRHALLMLLPLTLAGLMFVLSVLVETDREAIASAVSAIAGDVQANRPDALEKFLDESFMGSYKQMRLDKPSAVSLCLGEKRRFSISRIQVTNPEIVVRDGKADMDVTADMIVDATGLGSYPVKVDFILRWIRRPQGWRIYRAEEPRAQGLAGRI